MKNMKRIHKVTIKRMVDESPDTSWLGEYGNSAESEFSIDRDHATDCASQTYNKPTYAIEKLERVIAYLETVRQASEPPENIYWAAADESQDTLIELQDELVACSCSGKYRERNSYQFFNPNHENYTGSPHEEIVKYCLQDFARMESMNNGDFCFIGIAADAKIVVNNVCQTISSGGLWGIESDAGDYLKEIESEQLAELKSQLKAIGFSSRAISVAFRNVETEEN